MRKTLIGMATVLVAMSSCMEDEVLERNQGNALAFRASIDKALSRSGNENVTDLGKLQKFKVTATIAGQSNYFTDMMVNKTPGSTWNTEHTYYWPSYELGFYAYAPTGISGVSINKDGKKIADFTPDKDVNQQIDLLVAYNTGNRTANEASGVELNFKHALSQIDVQAKCSNPNIEIVVKSIRFVNVKTKGSFTYPDQTTTAGNFDGCWAPGGDLSGGADYKASFEQSKEVTLESNPKSINSSKNNFMLIPQKLTKWVKNTATTGAYIAVLCRISSKDGDAKTQLYPELASGGDNATKFGSIIVPIDTNWEAGKKYTYTLNFCGDGGGAGQVDPNPDTTDPNVDPNPKPGSNGGDPVLGNPIKFTVKVESWTDASVSEINL